MPHVATWMDLEIIILSEVNPDSKKKKKIQMNFIYKTETDSQTWKTNVSSPKEKGRGRDKLGVWN